MPALPNFIGQAYTGRSRAVDAQQCINLYPEIEEQSSKNVMALIGTPGLSLSETESPGSGLAGRGIYSSWQTNGIYFVIGNTVYSQLLNGSTVNMGTTTSTSGTVRFAEGTSNNLLMVDGTDGYIIQTVAQTMTKITRTGAAAGFPTNPTHCANIGGYFIANKGSSGNFYWSSVDDPTTWSALDFANAEGATDEVMGLEVNRNELWVIGKYTTEVWYLTGETDSSDRFLIIPGTLSNKGTIAKYSTQQMQDHVFFLGSGNEGFGCVWMSNGYAMQKISTPAIEYQIKTDSDLSDAVAFIYQLEGHVFYCLSLPNADKTWVYDLYTGMWHQWSYLNPTKPQSVANERAKCIYQAFFNGKNYVLDRDNANLYTLEIDTYTDNGQEIRRVRTSPHVHNDLKRVFYHSFELDLEKGVGLTTGQGSDPQVALQISNDGGYTYGTELWTGMGKVGEYLIRAQWHRLGYSRDRVFKVIISDPVKVVLINAHIEIELSNG